MSRSRLFTPCLAMLLPSLLSAAPPTQPATKPVDPDLDWIMNHSTTEPAAAPAPAAEPTSRESPLAKPDDGRGARPGAITTSDGERVGGLIATTREKPIRLWDDEKKEYRDIPFAAIRSMEAKILWERDEAEWHFIEGGSDIKEYTGKTYPARELVYTVTLLNGQTLTGGIVSPLYLIGRSKEVTFVLNKRQKGDVGQKLGQLVYVKRVEFDEAKP